MTDLKHLFSRSKSPLPLKRLFNQEHRDRQRGVQPAKDYARKVSGDKAIDYGILAKRHLNKSQLKKELLVYNKQILLTVLRKVFFFMVAVLTFHILATQTNQMLIVANLFLVLTVIDIPFGFDCMGRWWFKILHQILKIGAFCINFLLIFNYIRSLSKTFIELDALSYTVIGNAGLNYAIFRLCLPMINVWQINNLHSPYMSLVERVAVEVKQYMGQFRTILQLKRVLVYTNLLYWLTTCFFIIYYRNDSLFTSLTTVPVLRSYIASALFLHLSLYLLKLIDRKMSIELLSRNKKQINLNLLRLQCCQPNNQDILREIQKYIWSSCQYFWDTDFLSHRYNINYDMIDDYLKRELKTLNSTVQQILRESQSRDRDQEEMMRTSGKVGRIKGCLKYRDLDWKIIKLVRVLDRKSYLLFIIEQIQYFYRLGVSSPLNLDALLKSFFKLSQHIQALKSHIKIRQVRSCLQSLNIYLKTVMQNEDE